MRLMGRQRRRRRFNIRGRLGAICITFWDRVQEHSPLEQSVPLAYMLMFLEPVSSPLLYRPRAVWEGELLV